MNAAGEKQLAWTVITGWWNPDEPLSDHRTEVSCGINVSACEVHVEWGWSCNTNLQLRMCLLRAPFLGSHSTDTAAMQGVFGGVVAALGRRQPMTWWAHGLGPKAERCYIALVTSSQETALPEWKSLLPSKYVILNLHTSLWIPCDADHVSAV